MRNPERFMKKHQAEKVENTPKSGEKAPHNDNPDSGEAQRVVGAGAQVYRRICQATST